MPEKEGLPQHVGVGHGPSACLHWRIGTLKVAKADRVPGGSVN